MMALTSCLSDSSSEYDPSIHLLDVKLEVHFKPNFKYGYYSGIMEVDVMLIGYTGNAQPQIAFNLKKRDFTHSKPFTRGDDTLVFRSTKTIRDTMFLFDLEFLDLEYSDVIIIDTNSFPTRLSATLDENNNLSIDYSWDFDASYFNLSMGFNYSEISENIKIYEKSVSYLKFIKFDELNWVDIDINSVDTFEVQDKNNKLVYRVYSNHESLRFTNYDVYDSIPIENISYNPHSHQSVISLDTSQYFLDDRDFRYYRKTKIGNQIWMAENLNFSGVIGFENTIGYCYNQEGSDLNTSVKNNFNCDEYGRLYDWATAMNIDSNYLDQEYNLPIIKHQGICPIGWHVPSYEEWETLRDYVGNKFNSDNSKTRVGLYLNALNAWPNDTNLAQDLLGFSALPAGGIASDFVFQQMDTVSRWWSASQLVVSSYTNPGFTAAENSRSVEIWEFSNGLYIINSPKKKNYFSLRCIQN